MIKNIVPGYVDTMDPFTVRLAALDDVPQSAEQGGYAQPGMRGMVDVSGGGRLWIGEYASDGVPVEVRERLGDLSERVGGLGEAGNHTSQALSEFEVTFSTERAATAIELTDIRDSVAGIKLTALTTTRLAVISQDAGLYIDPTFTDAAISAERATNTGMVYTSGSGLSGAAPAVFLTGQGKDEGATIPLIVGDRYTARVWGTGLTAVNGYTLAIKHSNGVITSLPSVQSGDSLAATAVPTSASARLLVRRLSGTGSVTITRVEVRHGIGGTLIDDNSVNADKINVDKAVIGLKLTSPNIETNPAVNLGLKMIGDRLTGYSPTGQLQIDIGGPEGIIKGMTVEGGLIRTAAPGSNRMELTHSATLDQGRLAGYRNVAAGDIEVVLLDTGGALTGSGRLRLSSVGTAGSFVEMNTYELTWDTSRGRARLWHKVDGLHINTYYLESDVYIGDPGRANKVLVNGVEVSGRTETVLSSAMTLVRQGRTRELILSQTGTFNEGNTTAFGTVPVADRPTGDNARGGAYLSGAYVGLASVTTAGEVIVTNRSGATRTTASARIPWTV